MKKKLTKEGLDQIEAHLKATLKRIEESNQGLKDVLAREDILYIIDNDLEQDIDKLLSILVDYLGSPHLALLVSKHLTTTAAVDGEGLQPQQEIIAEADLQPQRVEAMDVLRSIPKEVVLAKRPSDEEYKER